MKSEQIELELLRRVWKREPSRYFEDCLTIQPKVGENCKLLPNAHQKKIQAAIDAQRQAGKPVRIIILKPRQTGISTASAANLFYGIRFHGGVGMVVSKDLDSSEHIFSIVQRFYHYLPDSEKEAIQASASSRRELKFEEPHGGRILVETAGKTSAGHSFTIRRLLFSEVSRWPEGCDDSIIGLLNAVDYKPDTEIIIESVANGMQGWFYQEWHNKDSDYEKVFLPWFEHNEYQRELPTESALYSQTLNDEERRLVADFGLSLNQVEWRRWATRNNCKGDPEKFKEQYPATAREAFLASGNAFFHIPTLEAIETAKGMACNLQVFTSGSGVKEIKPVPNERGLLTIWARPQSGCEYVIGADVAEGIEIEGAPPDDRHDYSSADVIDRNTGEQVAHFHARITPDEFGRQLSLLGEWYNHAFIGIESNAGYGPHALDTLKQEGYPEHLLYRDPNTDKLGWQTTRPKKKSLMAQLDMALREKELFVKSEDTLHEMRAFVVKPDGRLEAGAGHKDDRVMSLAIGYQMLIMAPAVMLQRGLESSAAKQATHYPVYRSIYGKRFGQKTRIQPAVSR